MNRDVYSKKGFISYQTKKIEELIENCRISLAKKLALELLPDYSHDLKLLKALARIYTIEQDYESAKEILESVEEVHSYKRLIAIYMKLNEEEKLFDLYKKYYSDSAILDKKVGYDENDRRLKLYLEMKFNPSFEVDIDSLSYYEKQIYDYDEVSAIEHIKTHHCKEYTNENIFSSEIDIVDLFYKVRESIDNNREKGTLGKSAGEIYFFNYPQCGIKNDTDNPIYTNTFKVCTLIGTNKIITMYPCLMGNCTNLCYLENSSVRNKIKVKTGIERFNSKYGNLK